MSDETRVMAYQSEGGSEVKLSPGIVRQYLVNGKGNVNDQEVMMFMMLCKNQKLDPFQRDAYLIKYGDHEPATMVVGKDTFTKRAERHADFRGFAAGVIVLHDGGTVEREGSMVLENEELVGGWARVYKVNREAAYYQSVGFNEYAGRTKEGELNRQWRSKPATMIRKVALVQALREAFPESFSGMYDPAEMAGDLQDAELPRNVTPARPAAPKQKPRPTDEEVAPIVGAFREQMLKAKEEQLVSPEQYDEKVGAIANHVKAGDFDTYAASTLARIERIRAEVKPEKVVYEPPKPDQPELIDAPPIF